MDWFTLTLILACIATTLVLCLRAIPTDVNPFLFMALVTLGAAIGLAGYCLATGISLDIGGKATKIALMAGCSVAILDLGFIFMFRKGATVSVSMQVFRVGGIVLSAFVGLVLFQEGLNLVKLAGIALACLSVYLLSSKSKGEV
jgi:multidrug transporter EmrE-like cation transporter